MNNNTTQTILIIAAIIAIVASLCSIYESQQTVKLNQALLNKYIKEHKFERQAQRKNGNGVV